MILPHVSSLSTQIYPGGIWYWEQPGELFILTYHSCTTYIPSDRFKCSSRPCMLLSLIIYQYIITWSVCESYKLQKHRWYYPLVI